MFLVIMNNNVDFLHMGKDIRGGFPFLLEYMRGVSAWVGRDVQCEMGAVAARRLLVFLHALNG